MQEAQRLAPHDAVQAGEVFGEREAAPAWPDGRGAHDAGSRFRRSAGQAHERGVDVVGAGVGDEPRDRAVRQHPPLMQHHEVVAGHDLVEQMRGPQHADALLGDELPDVAEDIGAGLDVEADGRLVEQQQARAMQQRAGDFQPPHLAAGEVAHLAAGAVGKPDARQHLVAAQARVAPGDAVQGGVIQQVLRHREIEIERARLEHDAEQPQRFARRTADVVAENADASGLDAEQPRHQREQRALAGAVEAEQRRETRRRDGEVDVDRARAAGHRNG